MPSAVTSPTDTEHFDLRTCEGGFVKLRRMTYGEFLKRQELAMGMSMQDAGGNNPQLQMAMSQRKVAEFEFANCIVEHNLEDENGTLLDFKQSFNLDRLDPRVGNEISSYIDKMNQFDEGN